MDLVSLKSKLTSPKTISLAKKISYSVGTLAMFVGSIFYMIMSDLGFGNESSWLIIATLLSMGSAVCQFFSSNMKDRPTVQIVLRSVAIALGIGYIVFLHLFTVTDFYKAVVFNRVAVRNACTIISLIFAYVATLSQIANLVLIATIKDE